MENITAVSFVAHDGHGNEKIVTFNKKKKTPRMRTDGTVIATPEALVKQAERVKNNKIQRDSKGRFVKEVSP